MFGGSANPAPPFDVPAEIARLESRMSALPPAQREACALMLAARLVEAAAYANASDGTLPVTTRLMMWAHDIERMSERFTATV